MREVAEPYSIHAIALRQVVLIFRRGHLKELPLDIECRLV